MNVIPRILVLTLSFGAGHPRAAEAIAEELKRTSPKAQVRVVDALKDCRSLFRACYEWPYWIMIRHAPVLWRRFFARRARLLTRRTAPEWAFQWGCPGIFKLITEFKPHLIVATEVAACELAAIAKRHGLTSARIVSVITDHEAEPAWVQSEIDVYAVGDDRVRDELCAWGARSESIVISGIPTDLAFQVRHNRRYVREVFGVSDETPIVLIMGGGMGPTRMDKIVAQLIKSQEEMHIIAVSGHDTRMHRRLVRLRALPPVSLHVLGWTEDVPALMQAASLLVTKPGGLTIAEAALSALPVVIFDAIPGPERQNATRVVEAGAGVLTNGPQEAALVVITLLHDHAARQRMSTCFERMARPKAASMISSLALDANVSAQELARKMTA